MQLDPLILGLLAVFVVLMIYTLLSFFTSRKPPAMPPKILTKIACVSGNYSEVREFREGDYVGKEVGKCPKCEGRMLVSMIYAEKPRPHVRKGYKSPQPKVSAAPVPAIGSRRRPDSYRTRKLSCSR